MVRVQEGMEGFEETETLWGTIVGIELALGFNMPRFEMLSSRNSIARLIGAEERKE